MCFGWSPFYAESRIEEYERILQMEIKIPNKRGYGPELKDLLLKVSCSLSLSAHFLVQSFAILGRLADK